MNPEDIPSPVDFHNEAEARAWIEQAIQTRQHRAAFFNTFVSEVSTLEGRNIRVLELGSGPGMLAEEVLRRCTSVSIYTLLDFSEPMLAVSRERLGEFAARLRFARADFRSADWIAKVGAADAVLSMQAVHEVRHKRHVPAWLLAKKTSGGTAPADDISEEDIPLSSFKETHFMAGEKGIRAYPGKYSRPVAVLEA